MFTERHFCAVAAVFKRTRPSDHGWQTTAEYRVWRDNVDAMSALFRAHNDRFKPALFNRACGRDR